MRRLFDGLVGISSLRPQRQPRRGTSRVIAGCVSSQAFTRCRFRAARSASASRPRAVRCRRRGVVRPIVTS
eukprot:8000545-Pyramimonas_sp.AAC.1